ncbi:phenylacetate--CoA ligase family protein [Desulfobacterota bacterium M19]
MYPIIAKYAFYTVEFFRQEYVYRHLKELEKNQFLSPCEINNLKSNKLNKLLKYVLNNNLFYQKKYTGFNPLEDFSSIPILTKDELRENYNNIVTKQHKQKTYLVETSGSTGAPLQFYRDKLVFGYTLASLYRGHRWWGLDIGFKEAMLWGIPIDYKNRLKAKLKDIMLNRFREREYNISHDTLFDFYHKVKRRRPDYLFGYSSMIYEFAMFLQEMNLPGGNLGINNAICTAEQISSFQRKTIESTFECKVISEYGATETGIITYECPSGNNHISDDCVYVEIVDDNNMPVPDGEPGRVIVTVLHSFSSPIIRYELGDIACKSSYNNCNCGVNLSSLEKIIGRTSDIVLTPGGQSYHSIIFYYIIKDFTRKHGGIKQFKVRQSALDRLEFHLVLTDQSTHIIETYIRKQIRKKFGGEMKLEFIYHDYLKREKSGKLRDFESVLDTTGCANLKLKFRS